MLPEQNPGGTVAVNRPLRPKINGHTVALPEPNQARRPSQRIARNQPIAMKAKMRPGQAPTAQRIKPAVKRKAVQKLAVDRKLIKRRGFIDPDGTRSQLAEEFRLIKRPLLARAFAADADPRDRVILVTSSRPGEGKTFSAVNLAISLSRERDANVLLIDADQAVSGSSVALNLPRAPGLVDLLGGSAVDPGEILRQTDVERMWFIPPGNPDLDLTELVASSRMSNILDAILRADPKRVIVIDAPPMLATSEAMALTMHAGQTVFVVEAGGTPRDNVEEALAMVAERTEVQILLNKAHIKRSRAAYYGSYYATYGDKVSDRQSFWRRMGRLVTGQPLSITILAAMGLAATPIALASIAIVPRIEAALGYTDNINYSTEAESDFGSEIAPGIELTARTARIAANADYSARQTLLLDNSDENDLGHNLTAQIRGELWSDALFLDLEADIDQNRVDSRGPRTRPIFGGSDNFAQQFTRSVSPFFRREIGGLGDLELRYRYTRSSFNDNEAADANSHFAGAVIDGAPTGGPFSWSAQVLYDDTHFENTKDEGSFGVKSGVAAASGRYEINTAWAVLASLGYSTLEDDTLDNRGDDSVYWEAGLDYRPNSLYGVTATVGQSFAEPIVDVEASAQLADGVQLEAAYTEGLQSRFRLLQDRLQSRDLLTNDRRRSDERFEPLDRLETLIPESDVDQVDEATFRQRRGELYLNAIQGRSAYRLSGFVEDRDFDAGDDDRFIYGAGAAFTRQLTRRSELTLGVNYARTEFDADDTTEDDINLRLNYAYDINPTTAIDVGYDLYQRYSSEDDNDITGNTVFVRLRKTF